MKQSVRWVGVMAMLLIAITAVLAQTSELTPDMTTESSDRFGTSQERVIESDTSFVSEGGVVAVQEPSEKAMRYYRSGNLLWVVENLWVWVVPLILLFGGLSARFEKIGWRYGKRWYFAFVVYILLYMVADFALSFPLLYYSGFVHQHAFGLSNQSFGAWFGDAITELMVWIIAGLLFLWIPLLLIQHFPRRWWLFFSVGSIPFIVLVVMISPIWIQPLFDDFGPMNNKLLEREILALADHAGIDGGRVFEVNKSEDTNVVNAYVTGFGATKRIVVWDTLVEKMEEEEVLFVVAHEMGHYVLGHMYLFIGLATLLVLIGFYAVHRTGHWVLRKWGSRFGFHHLSDMAALPLILLLFSLAVFVVTPFVNGFSRHNETVCDKFGLELTRDNHAAATAFTKLQESNLDNPRPGWLYKMWRASHPPIGERIDLMNSYKPWEDGGHLKYSKYIKPLSQEE